MNARTEELIRYTNELAENAAKAAPDMYYMVLAPKQLRDLSASELLGFAEHFGADVNEFCGSFEAKVTIKGVSINARSVDIAAAKNIAPSPMDVLRATVSQSQSIAA